MIMTLIEGRTSKYVTEQSSSQANIIFSKSTIFFHKSSRHKSLSSEPLMGYRASQLFREPVNAFRD